MYKEFSVLDEVFLLSSSIKKKKKLLIKSCSKLVAQGQVGLYMKGFFFFQLGQWFIHFNVNFLCCP